MTGLKSGVISLILTSPVDEKNVNDYLTKNRRYIMKDYSLFVLKVRQRL